jgi:hypothetical protein
LSPFPNPIVLEKNNKHETLPTGPSAGDHFWVYSIVILVINLLESALLDKLADFFPVVAVDPLLFYDKLFFSFIERLFGDSDLMILEPSFVYFYTSFEARWLSDLSKVY